MPAAPSGHPLATPAELYDHDVARWRGTATKLSGFGAFGLVVCALLPSTSDHDSRAFAIAAVFSLIAAFGLAWLSGSRARFFLPVSIVWSLALVTCLTATLEHTGAFPFFYMWPLLSGATLLPTRRSVMLGVATFALCAGAFAVRPAGMDVLMLMNIGVVNLGVTTAVRALRGGRDDLFRDLQRTAETDGLTGLLNRRAFQCSAQLLLDRSAQSAVEAAVVLFDIDHFKRLNDEHGHATGDAALKDMAAILTEHARSTDVIGRIGGEEFAVVIGNASVSDAVNFADRVASALRAGSLSTGSRLTVSAGVALANGQPLQKLLQQADEALYCAKGAGRDRVQVAECRAAA